MSTHCIQNVVPKKCAFDYVKMCTKTAGLMLGQRVVMNDLLKNSNVSDGKMKLCVDRDRDCGGYLVLPS
jgi:hypothetical protein